MIIENAFFDGIFMNFLGKKKAMAITLQSTVMPSQILINLLSCLGIAKEGIFLHTSPPLTDKLATRKQFQL